LKFEPRFSGKSYNFVRKKKTSGTPELYSFSLSMCSLTLDPFNLVLSLLVHHLKQEQDLNQTFFLTNDELLDPIWFPKLSWATMVSQVHRRTRDHCRTNVSGELMLSLLEIFQLEFFLLIIQTLPKGHHKHGNFQDLLILQNSATWSYK